MQPQLRRYASPPKHPLWDQTNSWAIQVLSRRNRLPITLFSSRAFLNSSPPVTPSILIQSCSGPLFLWPSSASWGAVTSHVMVSLTTTYTSPVGTLASSWILLVRNTWKSASRSPRPTHSGKLQLSPSPVLNPTSVPWLPQEISSSKHPTPPRKAPCSSLRMAPLSHDVPWPRTYSPCLSCATFNLITTTPKVSELGQPQQQLPLAYPRGLSRFLAADTRTPMKGTFTSLKLPYCKYRLLWLPTTRTTLELRT